MNFLKMLNVEKSDLEKMFVYMCLCVFVFMLKLRKTEVSISQELLGRPS